MLGYKQKKSSPVQMTSPPWGGGPIGVIDKAAWWERRKHGFNSWCWRYRIMLG